eukprot:11665875-Alexandrium_andersonii.AAC.1
MAKAGHVLELAQAVSSVLPATLTSSASANEAMADAAKAIREASSTASSLRCIFVLMLEMVTLLPQ